MADPYEVLGLPPGASKADIKAAFRKLAHAHHPDKHANASDGVRRANDAAFKALNEAYQLLMDDSLRQRLGQQQRGRGGGFAGSSRGGSGYYGGGGAADPFASSYHRTGSSSSSYSYSGYYRQRPFWGRHGGSGGLDFAGLWRSFSGIGRGEAAVTLALGLLLAGVVALFDPLAGSLWQRHNEGKLFASVAEDSARRRREAAVAAAAAATAAAAVEAEVQQQQQQQQQQPPPPPQQQQASEMLPSERLGMAEAAGAAGLAAGEATIPPGDAAFAASSMQQDPSSIAGAVSPSSAGLDAGSCSSGIGSSEAVVPAGGPGTAGDASSSPQQPLPDALVGAAVGSSSAVEGA